MDDRDVVLKGSQLAGLSVDLVVAGGIAAVEAPKLIRELRRYGASVRVFMTASACKFITPLSLEWASRQSVVTDLSGSAEHIASSDMVVVAPATLDFVGKASWGLADSAALTLVQSALQRLPVFFAPSMHESLSQNPLFQENKRRLSKLKNVFFLDPVAAEGKMKAQGFESMVARICHLAGSASQLRGQKVGLTLGPTRSIVDDVRYLSNRSSGAMGLAIADELYRRGADVYSIAGPLQASWPEFLQKVDVETNGEMHRELSQIVARKKPSALIFAAAVLDFDVESARSGKTSSAGGFEVSLRPSKKIIHSFAKFKGVKVGFKLESQISEKSLVLRARESLKQHQLSFVVANRLEDVSKTAHRAFLVFKDKQIEVVGRSAIASAIADALAESI